MDFATDITEHTAECAIKHPGTGAFTGLTIEVRSLTSPQAMAVRKRIDNEALKLRQRNKMLDADKIAENETALLLVTCVNWTWGKGDDGKQASFQGEQLPFTSENVSKLLAFPYIRAQLNDVLNEDANFF